MEYEILGHMREVPDRDEPDVAYYATHRGVYRKRGVYPQNYVSCSTVLVKRQMDYCSMQSSTMVGSYKMSYLR